jgi:AbiV family abortive infection protein
VDVEAVLRTDRRVLVGYAADVAENARGLLADGELLLEVGRWARAYSLALLAAEGWAKAYSVLTLSLMTAEMRARVPVRKFLEWHRLKLAGAFLIRVLDAARPGVAAMPDLAGVLSAAGLQADNANAAKQRRLYADLFADGTVSLPSAITEGEAAEAAARARARARESGASAALLHDQDALAKFADPPSEALDLADVLFGRLFEAEVDDAEAAAALIGDVAARLSPAEDPEAEAASHLGKAAAPPAAGRLTTR